jgi:hypothetical protein
MLEQIGQSEISRVEGALLRVLLDQRWSNCPLLPVSVLAGLAGEEPVAVAWQLRRLRAAGLVEVVADPATDWLLYQLSVVGSLWAPLRLAFVERVAPLLGHRLPWP